MQEPNALLNLQLGKKRKKKKHSSPNAAAASSPPRAPCVHGRCSCPRVLRPGSAGPTRALVVARCRARGASAAAPRAAGPAAEKAI